MILTLEELEQLKKAITVPYQGSDLPGAKICHGTATSQIGSILRGIQNSNIGFGGAGLNVVLLKEDHIARDSAHRRYVFNDKGVILEGHFNPSQNYRVARIKLSNVDSVDVAKGIFPRHWASRSSSLHEFIMQNFDIVELVDAQHAGLSINSNRFFIIHESAGPEVVLWNGTRPILEAHRVEFNAPRLKEQQLQLAAQKSLTAKGVKVVHPDLLADTNHCRNALSKVTRLKAPILLTHFPVAAGQVPNFLPLSVPYYIPSPSSERTLAGIQNILFKPNLTPQLFENWDLLVSTSPCWINITKLEEMAALPFTARKSNRVAQMMFQPKSLVEDKIAGKTNWLLPIFAGLEVYSAYQTNPEKGKGTALVNGVIDFSLTEGAYLPFYFLPSAGFAVGALSYAAEAFPPKAIQEIFTHQARHMDTNGLGAGPDSRFVMGAALTLWVGPWVKKGEAKIKKLSDYINHLPIVQATGQAINPSVEAVCETVVKFTDLLIAGQCLTMYGSARGYATAKLKKAESSIQSDIDNKSTPVIPSLSGGLAECSPFSLNQLFTAIDPQPAHLPQAPDIFAVSNLTVDQTLSLNRAPDTLANQLNHNSNSQQIEIKLQALPLANKQSIGLGSTGYSLHQHNRNKANKNPLIGDYRIAWSSAGLSLALTLKTSGVISVTFGKTSALLGLSVKFGAGFWTAMGAGLGIGTAIAVPMAIAQHLYIKHLKHLAQKTQRSLRHTSENRQFINAEFLLLEQACKQDLDTSQLINLTHTTILLVEENIHREIRRIKQAQDRKHKQAVKLHQNVVVHDYQLRLQQLRDLQQTLDLEKLYQETYQANKGKNAEELLNHIKIKITDNKLTVQVSYEAKALCELLIFNAANLFSQGKSKQAMSLIREAHSWKYYQKDVIKPFNYSQEKNNHKDNKYYRGRVKNELNAHIQTINTHISNGKDPVPALNALILHVVDKIRHYNAHKNPIIAGDLAAFQRQLESMRTYYQTQGNQANDLHLTDIADVFNEAMHHADEDESYWLAYHPGNHKKDAHDSCAAQEKNHVKEMIADNQLLHLASKRTNAGYFHHSAALLNHLSVLKPDLAAHVKQELAQLQNLDKTQTRTALMRPILAMITRYLRGFNNSFGKNLVLHSMSISQTLIPNMTGLAMQAAEAWYAGSLSSVMPYFKETLGQQLSPLAHPLSRNNALLLGQMSMKFGQIPLELLLPKTIQAYPIQQWLADTRTTLSGLGSKVLQAYYLYQAIADLKNLNFRNWSIRRVSATAALSAANLAQTAIETFSYAYERYKASRGDAIENPAYYHKQMILETAVDGIGNTLQMADLRHLASVLTGGMAALSAANTLHSLYGSSPMDDALKKALLACINNLCHYHAVRDKKQTSYFTSSVIKAYLTSARYLFLLQTPDEEHLAAVRTGASILITQEEGRQYVYLRTKNAGHERIEANNIFEPLTENAVSWQELKEDCAELIEQAVINLFEQATLQRMETLVQDFGGLRYRSDQDEIVNRSRMILLTSQIDKALLNKDYEGVLSLSELVNKKANLNKSYQLPLSLAVNLIIKRLAALASQAHSLPAFHQQFSKYIQALYEACTLVWRKAHWEDSVQLFKNILINTLQNSLITASSEKDVVRKRAILDTIVQEYIFCGDWHTLLDDEYKLLAAYCFYQAKEFQWCGNFIDNINNVEALLQLKKAEAFAQTALIGLYTIDRKKCHELLNVNNREKLAITDQVLQNIVTQMLLEGQSDEAIEWIARCNPFIKKDYLLARCYFQSGQFYNAMQVLAAEPMQDEEYWLLWHGLLTQLMQRTVQSNCPDRMNAYKKILTMVKICCAQLLTFNLAQDSVHLFRNQDKRIKEELGELVSIKRMQQGMRFFNRTTEEKLDILLLKTRQWMLGKSRVQLHQQIRTLFTIMNCLPQDEIRFVPVEEYQATETDAIPGLTDHAIPGDGHCLYRSISYYLGQTPNELRQQAADYIEKNSSKYEPFIELREGKTFQDYLKNIRHSNQFATQVEIDALMNHYQRPIIVLAPDNSLRTMEAIKVAGEPIFVRYNDHNHYDALLLNGEKTAQEVLSYLLPEHERSAPYTYN